MAVSQVSFSVFFIITSFEQMAWLAEWRLFSSLYSGLQWSGMGKDPVILPWPAVKPDICSVYSSPATSHDSLYDINLLECVM
jgi:hypothetical protein